MIVIQVLIIIFALGILIFMLVGGQTHSARAWKKIGLCLLAISMIVAVASPDITNKIAHVFGVGRGADLLLYALVIAFITYVLNLYIKHQRERDSLIRLARKVAIIEAKDRYKL